MANRKNCKKKEIRDILKAKNIIKYGIDGAYQMDHPNSSPKSTVMNSWRVLSKEVKQYIREFVEAEAIVEVNKENLVKFYELLLSLFLMKDKRVKASDFRAALADLSKLCPEFKERYEHLSLDNKTEKELDDDINKLMDKYRGIGAKHNDEDNSTVN